MIRDMVRIAVWGLTSQRSDVIEVLHDLGVVHLETPHRTELSTEEIDNLRLLRGKLLGLLEALDWKEWHNLNSDLIDKARKSFDLPVAVAVKEVDRSLDQFNERLSVTIKEKDNLRDLYLQLHQAEEIINHFKGFLTDEEKRGKTVSLWWTSKNTQTRLLNELRKEIRKLTPVKDREYLRYHSVPIREKENLLSVSVDLDGLPAVLSVMDAFDSIKWKAPSTVSETSLLESVKQVEENLSWIPFRLEELDKAVSQTRNSWGPKLASLFILADEKLEELLVEEASMEKGNYFMLEGWIPADELTFLSTKLQTVFKDDVLLRWRFPSSDEWNLVPTCLYNWKVFKPFELFLKLLETPKYKSMDPTAFIAIFFPFFSGCMVGDIGYGLVSSAFGYFLFRKKDKPILSDIGYILLFVSFWSILWGFAFGEFFGDLGHKLFHLEPIWLERSHAVMPVIIFTVALGAAHVILGLLLGIYDGIKQKHRHHWMEKAGNLGVLLSLFLCLVVLKGWLPGSFFTISVTLLVISLALLMAGGGIGGLVESLGTFGNILSYVRIAAIGLSSAILAIVASEFINVFGVGILGIFMAFAIHILNFVLAIGGSGLHSARLHYVEFMGKFYSSGGEEYKPFSRRRSFSWKKR